MIRHAFFAVAALSIAGAASAAPARHFLNDAAKGDRSEVMLGRYIAAHGDSAAVRNFGSVMVRDHSRAGIQVAQVARRMNLSLEGGTLPQAKDELGKLRGLRGAAFDREVRRFMIDDHQEDIGKFQSQASGGEPMTARLARQTLPTLRHHLAMARAL